MENKIDESVKYYNRLKEKVGEIYCKAGKVFFAEDAKDEFEQYMFELFLGIAFCHNPVSLGETAFMERIFGEQRVNEIIYDETNITVKAREKRLITIIPNFLNDIMLFDKKNKFADVNSLLNKMQDICLQLASIDENYSEEECKFITLVFQNLRSMVKKQTPIGFDFLDKYRKKEVYQKTISKILTENTVNSMEMKEEKVEIIETTEEILAELDDLIGLEEIKHEIETLINLTKVNLLRTKRGLKVVPMSRHMVFTGNPGTGKTTIARIIARIYKSLGVLSKGHLIEVDRSSLVAGYVGQTANNVKKVVESALGGILFIDEAYSLTYSENSGDFGQEAIDTLVKLMEDNREDLVVIVAGYKKEMENFLNSNPGLKSRFNKYIEFQDYSLEEMFAIFMSMIQKNGFILENGGDELVKNVLKEKQANPDFGNGRGVRNCFEKLLEIQANRIVCIEKVTDTELQMITLKDLELLK